MTTQWKGRSTCRIRLTLSRAGECHRSALRSKRYLSGRGVRDASKHASARSIGVEEFSLLRGLLLGSASKLTVLVADNGHGKTAVLDAISISLELFVDTIAGKRQSHGFERSDVRRERLADGSMRPALPVLLTASGSADGAR